jgi:hypothetical protein
VWVAPQLKPTVGRTKPEEDEMIKITITPPNQPSFSQEFTTVSDAYDFLEALRIYGYAGAKKAAQQSVKPTKKGIAAGADFQYILQQQLRK